MGLLAAGLLLSAPAARAYVDAPVVLGVLAEPIDLADTTDRSLLDVMWR